MRDQTPIDPGHQTTRGFFRVVGPAVLLIGVGFIVVGMVDFFRSFGSFGPPTLFWCHFVGIPVLFVGAVMTQMG
jgi:hypothetical protein